MKRFTECFVALALTVAMCFGLAVPVQAAEGTTIAVTSSDISASGACKAIQSALNTARYNATESNPYTVTVAAGSYSLNACLKIFSNTTLKLNGVTLTRAKDGNMLKVGDIDEASNGVTGYYYKNIAVEGGTLDGNSAQGYTGTILKAGHTEGFSMTGVTLQNCLNSHIMETGGMNGLTVSNCTFKNQITDGNAGSEACYEALQLDILYSTHMNGYRSEDLATKNVTVTGCTFSNVPRGVGSHTAILNKPMSNVTVKNCTFTDISSAAIQFLYTKNLTISGNTITGAPRSIVVTMAGIGVFRPSTLASEGGLTTSASDSFKELGDQNITISKNTITMGTKDNPYTDEARIGIYAFGENKKSQGDAPNGNYRINGVTVTGNTLKNVTGHGIRIMDAENCDVTSNTVTHASLSSYEEDYYGISLREAVDCGSIKSNTVSGAPTNGIYVYISSSAAEISGNTVSKSGNNGIYVGESSAVTKIASNKVTSSGGIGIAVGGSKVTEISGNTVKSSTLRGIGIFNSSAVNKVTGNTVSSSGDYGIRYSSSSTGSLIEKNTVTGSKTKAIHVDSTSSVTKIGENYQLATPTLKSVSNSKNGVTVKWSSVSGATKYRVYYKGGSVSSWKKAGDTTSTSYTVTGLTSGTKYTFTVKVVSPGLSKYDTAGKSIKRLAAGTISSLTNTVKGVTVKWKKVTGASGYYVYRKTGSGSYSKIKTVTSGSTTSYTDTAVKSKSGTTYTYAVRPYSGDTKGAYTGKSIKRLAAGTISSLKNTSKGITVKWEKVKGASGYYIYRKTGSGSYSKIKTVTSGSTTSYTDTAVKSKNGTTYTYAVRAYSGDTKGSYVGKKTVRLTGVSVSSAKNSSSKKITVKWKKDSKATGYQIQYSTSSDFSSSTTVTISKNSTTSKTISSLKKNKKYYVRIRTYKTVSDTKYYSAWSKYGSAVKVTK